MSIFLLKPIVFKKVMENQFLFLPDERIEYQTYSKQFQNLFPNHYESFRTNPKNVLYLIWWKMIKNQSDLTQGMF